MNNIKLEYFFLYFNCILARLFSSVIDLLVFAMSMQVLISTIAPAKSLKILDLLNNNTIINIPKTEENAIILLTSILLTVTLLSILLKYLDNYFINIHIGRISVKNTNRKIAEKKLNEILKLNLSKISIVSSLIFIFIMLIFLSFINLTFSIVLLVLSLLIIILTTFNQVKFIKKGHNARRIKQNLLNNKSYLNEEEISKLKESHFYHRKSLNSRDIEKNLIYLAVMLIITYSSYKLFHGTNIEIIPILIVLSVRRSISQSIAMSSYLAYMFLRKTGFFAEENDGL